jgi:hypothetical protein
MDEEDGRPGPRARQFGPVDVRMDVRVRSLCRPASIPKQVALFTRISIASISSRQSLTAIQPTSNPAPLHGRGPAEGGRLSQMKEKHHENVSGK